MQRRTRKGTQFSPFEQFMAPGCAPFTTPTCEVVRTEASLEELLVAAQEAADRRQAEDDESDLSEWEDVDSCASSRPPSPVSSELSPCPSDVILSCPATPVTASTELPAVVESSVQHRAASPSDIILSRPATPAPTSAEFPAALESSAQRRSARDKAYQKSRRQKKRQAQAASPFTRQPHPKSLPTHRLLPAHHSAFDAADLQSSGGGSWLGKKPGPSKAKTFTRRTPKRRGANFNKVMKLRRLKELLDSMGYELIRWDGK
jgi:hypothetical protein